MKILFSPSENKIVGGSQNFSLYFNINRDSILTTYMNLVLYAELETLKKLFSTKKDKKVKEIKNSIISQKDKFLKSIERYSGVAFKYLDYQNLNKESKKYIDENTIIFSNLFGPILAKDNIPFYKLKQGMKILEINIENFYKENSSEILDKFLKDELIIDLRANHYKKFYKLKNYHITVKFYKDSKIITHYSKAYRGILLKTLAINSVTTEEEFKSLKFDTLKLEKIEKKSNSSEYIYSII